MPAPRPSSRPGATTPSSSRISTRCRREPRTLRARFTAVGPSLRPIPHHPPRRPRARRRAWRTTLAIARRHRGRGPAVLPRPRTRALAPLPPRAGQGRVDRHRPRCVYRICILYIIQHLWLAQHMLRICCWRLAPLARRASFLRASSLPRRAEHAGRGRGQAHLRPQGRDREDPTGYYRSKS